MFLRGTGTSTKGKRGVEMRADIPRAEENVAVKTPLKYIDIGSREEGRNQGGNGRIGLGPEKGGFRFHDVRDVVRWGMISQSDRPNEKVSIAAARSARRRDSVG